MKLRIAVGLIAAVLASICGVTASADALGTRLDFTYKQHDGSVDVLRDGKVAATYVYADTPKPYIYPLYGPGGQMMTRSYPMKSVDGEPTDHPHHRSFWIGYGDMNGIDFWAEGDKCGRIVQTSIDFLPLSPGYWSIHTTNDWIGPDGKKMCEDERHVTFLSTDYGTLISTVLYITASEADVQLGDTKEGFFALRLTPALQLKDGSGHILNSAGRKDNECWGQRARWCDYTGQIDGKTCGVTIFDSPRNYGYPTYWHVRDYGLFAANPFGGQQFTGKADNNSGLTIPKGALLRLVYAVLLHDGKLDAGVLDKIADQAVGKGPDPRTLPAPNEGSQTARPAVDEAQ